MANSVIVFYFNKPKTKALNFITPSLSANSLLIFTVSSLRAEERIPEKNTTQLLLDLSKQSADQFNKNNCIFDISHGYEDN